MNPKKLIKKPASKRNIIIAFIVLILCQVAYAISWNYSSKLQHFAKDMPDLKFYNASDLNKMIAEYSEAKLDCFYVYAIDFIMPITFVIIVCSLYFLMLKKRGKENLKFVPYLLILPLFSFTFDYLENIHVLINVLIYPNGLIKDLAGLLRTFSYLKFTFYASQYLTLIGMIVWYFSTWVINKRSKK